MSKPGMIKYRKQWETFAEVLRSDYHPATFEDTWAVVSDKVCGLYESEARALWNNLQVINPEKVVEIGRNLGGGLFFLICACPNAIAFDSYDITPYPLTDKLLERWGSYAERVQVSTVVMDSKKIKPNMDYDFVWIDGDHTGAGVKADIEIWKDNCDYIGFHDYADKKRNKHKRYFPDVVAEISNAANRYGWKMFGERGRSDIVFKISRDTQEKHDAKCQFCGQTTKGVIGKEGYVFVCSTCYQKGRRPYVM